MVQALILHFEPRVSVNVLQGHDKALELSLTCVQLDDGNLNVHRILLWGSFRPLFVGPRSCDDHAIQGSVVHFTPKTWAINGKILMYVLLIEVFFFTLQGA